MTCKIINQILQLTNAKIGKSHFRFTRKVGYNNGMIQENLRHAQDKTIAYKHLVANLVIPHNVESMSKAIIKFKRQGFKVDCEALRSFSSYRTEPINLLDSYSLQIPKQQGEYNFKLMSQYAARIVSAFRGSLVFFNESGPDLKPVRIICRKQTIRHCTNLLTLCLSRRNGSSSIHSRQILRCS